MEREYITARAAMQEGDVHRIRCIRTLVKQAGGSVGNFRCVVFGIENRARLARAHVEQAFNYI